MAATPANPINPRNEEASTPDVTSPTTAAAAERPRPEYGEYATPAEQAEAMGLTTAELAELTTLTPAAKPVDEPVTVTTPAVVSDKSTDTLADKTGDKTGELPPPTASDAIPLAPPAKAPDLQSGARRWDLPITYGLLFFSAFVLFDSLDSMRNLGSTMQIGFTQVYGDDAFSAVDLGNAFGVWLAVIQPVIFVLTVALTIMSIRKRRVSFYVPLIGGAVSAIVLFIFWLIVAFNDPVFVELVTRGQ